MLGVEGLDRLPLDTTQNFEAKYDTIIFLFIDSLGWSFIEPLIDRNPAFRSYANSGVLSKLNSVFPSTTAASVPSLITASTPSQTGIIEWRQFSNIIQDTIMPVKFEYAYPKGEDRELPLEYASVLYPKSTLFTILNQNSIQSHALMHANYHQSVFNKHIFNGTKTVPYTTISESMSKLEDMVTSGVKGLIYMYIDSFDSTVHKHGPNSPIIEEEIDEIINLFQESIQRIQSKSKNKLLVVMTADHGQSEVSDKNRIYLNIQNPALEEYLFVNNRGDTIYPAGSERDMFLKIKPGLVDQAYDLLKKDLDGHADIYKTSLLIKSGSFGENLNTLQEAVGDIAILPREKNSVWWHFGKSYEKTVLGQHGGVSAEEVEIPFLVFEP